MEYQEIERVIHSYSKIYLYGAGVVAYGAYKAMEGIWNIRPRGFLITEKNNQVSEIDGIAVLTLKESKINSEESLIIIATPEEYHKNIEDMLREWNISHYLKLDSHMEYVLMGRYLKEVQKLNLVEDYENNGSLKNLDNVRVYMAVSHKDKPLARIYKEEPWVKKIQVGAALTDVRICELTDLSEDSISDKNAWYGELTAAYYGWKYDKYNVTGLFHYRRVLGVTERQLRLLEEGTLDAILPLPFVCSPDASGQYGRYLLQSDIDIMLDVIREQDKKYYKETLDILKMPYLYNYNMMIVRREVFEEYCGWLFPLLKVIRNRCERDSKDRLPRYIGRIGEVLTSVYFMRNRERWKIGHAEKVWRI